MKALDFLIKEDGTISVDWVVLSTAVAVMCLGAAGILTTATNSFSAYNARELSIQNNNGQNLFDSADYVAENDVLYDAYVAGLSGLSLEELDAVAAFANRLHAVGYGADVGNADLGACDGATPPSYCQQIGGANDVANINDFLMAVNNEYTTRGKGRPSHTHIDSLKVGAAFETMGMTQNEIRALVQG